MKSIFELENRLDINKEFEKIVYELYEDEQAALYAEDEHHLEQYTSLIDAIDKMVFLKWKYRDTFMDVEEFIDSIGIDPERVLLRGTYYIGKEKFLLFLEFLINMYPLMKLEKIELSKRALALFQNIPTILEKMNYKLEEVEDKIVITKRDSNVDSVLTNVPNDIAYLLLEYNDFKICNDINEKKAILKAIDLYLDNDDKKIKKQIKGIDKELVDTFETILNNMGINHDNSDQKYKSMPDEEKIKWYDKCFLLIIHGIRAITVNEIKNERKELVKKDNI